MAKGKSVGLPGDFKLNVRKPVELGDYLDETSEAIAPKLRRPQAFQSPINPSEDYPEEQNLEAKAEAPKTGGVVQLREKKESLDEPQPKLKKIKPPKRKQINMSPQTLERFSELVTYVQEYSQQSDAAASEVMDAIISAHHDAMSLLRLGSIPPRGRWGSPTAQAFKDALSRSFTEALIEYHAGNRAKAV